jgi:NhaP-type Na+/H+ or K+/H+ antiporter
LLYGAIISATDPVAVVALLKELGAPKQLSTLIEGESLLNDGTAMVAFYILLDKVLEKESSFWDMFIRFVRLSGGGAFLGILTGIITSTMLHYINNDYVLEVNLTIVSCYIMFYFAEFTALHMSGIIALVALGLFMSFAGKTYISTGSSHALHHVWGYIGFCAETIIFILSGVIIGERILIE